MKIIFTLLFISLSIIFKGQIEIQHAHLPQAGETLVTRNATLLTEVDPELTGTDYTWTFGFDVLQPQNLNTAIICVDVNSTPFTSQLFFNNPFDPDHNSDYAIGVEQADVATLSFSDAYQYHKNSGGVFSVTGMGLSINSIPIAAQNNETDVLYDIPLNYSNNGSSNSLMSFDIPEVGYWGVDQVRTYECDGWGTINIWGQSFEVLRVRSVVNANDSIFTTLFNPEGFGFSLARPESISYEWISTEYNVPILKITSTTGFISQIATADIYDDPNNLVERTSSNFGIYPNPCKDELRISGRAIRTDVRIISSKGKLVQQVNVNSGSSVDVSSLSPGVYFVLLTSGSEHTIEKLIKE